MFQPASSAPLLSPQEAISVYVTTSASEATATTRESQAFMFAPGATSAGHTPQTSISLQVPQGAEPGSQIHFSTPDGQRLDIIPQERVQPGGSVRVFYTPAVANPRNMLPSSVVTAATQAQDINASRRNWIAYFVSLVCCCLCFPCSFCLSPITWCVLSARYFCKARLERQHLPKLRVQAKVSLVTLVLAACVFVAYLAGIYGFDRGFAEATFADNCPKWSKWTEWHCPPHGRTSSSHFRMSSSDFRNVLDSCDRKPNRTELSMICSEAEEDACHAAAKKLSLFEHINSPCRTHSSKVHANRDNNYNYYYSPRSPLSQQGQ
jgi:hypothetical protein